MHTGAQISTQGPTLYLAVQIRGLPAKLLIYQLLTIHELHETYSVHPLQILHFTM